jgi:hypothetical protein
MSHSIAAPLATADAKCGSAQPVDRTPTPAPVLITEQQVALSTAAAAPPAAGRRRRLNAYPFTELRRALTAATRPRPHCRRHEPSYFEVARTSRAMERL